MIKDKRPPNEPEGLHAEALSFLRPSQTRAERVISDLLYDANTPENIRESISKSFELSEDELLRLARQGVEAAIQFLGAVLEDRAAGPDKRLAETRDTLRRILEKQGLTPSTGSPAESSGRKVAIPGSPAWKAREARRARGEDVRRPEPKPERPPAPPTRPEFEARRPEGYLGGTPLPEPNARALAQEADGVRTDLDPQAVATKTAPDKPKTEDKPKAK